MREKKQDDGYMVQVMHTLRAGEIRKFDLADSNVQSWRTVASRENKKAGYKKYSIIKSPKLGLMAVKHNVYE